MSRRWKVERKRGVLEFTLRRGEPVSDDEAAGRLDELVARADPAVSALVAKAKRPLGGEPGASAADDRRVELALEREVAMVAGSRGRRLRHTAMRSPAKTRRNARGRLRVFVPVSVPREERRALAASAAARATRSRRRR